MAPVVPRRRVGTSTLEVPVLSLGSWHTYDRMDFADAVAMIRYAVEHGITLFDVGVYGIPGSTPTFTDVLFNAIMRAARIPREDYLVSTKLWIEGFGEQGFRPQLENAFFRADIEYADMAILGDLRHDDVELEDLVLDLAKLTEEGLIREWGVNNWSAGNIRALQEIAVRHDVKRPQIAQLKYSIARRSIPDGEPFEELFKTGFSMQSSDIMEGGILAGKVQTDRQVGRDPGEIRQIIIDAATGVAELSERLECTPAQLCVAFTLTHPANTTTLFGATRLDQVKQNLGALELVERIGAEELRSLVEPFWADRGVIDPEGP